MGSLGIIEVNGLHNIGRRYGPRAIVLRSFTVPERVLVCRIVDLTVIINRLTVSRRSQCINNSIFPIRLFAYRIEL